MISPVMIKGNKTGIRIILSPELDIKSIQSLLEKKLSKTGEYYANIKPISVTFEGKILTQDEKNQIYETLQKKGINITCTALNQKQEEKKQNRTTDKKQQIRSEKTGLFYVGNLKGGQSITAAASLVIVGDVEAGASVESAGNVIVIGSNCGVIKSGVNGRTDTFVYCLKNS